MRSSAIQSEAVHLVSGAAITSLPINLCHSRNGCKMTACQLPGAGAVWRECRLRSPLTGSRDLLPLIIAALKRRASQIVRPLDQGYGPVPLKCVPCGLFVLELLLLPMSPCSWRAPDQLRQTRLRAVPNASYRFFLQTIVGKQPDARLIHSLGPMNAPHGVPVGSGLLRPAPLSRLRTMPLLRCRQSRSRSVRNSGRRPTSDRFVFRPRLSRRDIQGSIATR